MDLEQFELKATASIHLRSPKDGELLYADNDEKRPIGVEVYGVGSKEYRREVARTDAKFKKLSDEQRQIEILVACTRGFNNFTFRGQEYSPEVCREMYEDPAFSWLKAQVSAGMQVYANFLEQ